MTSNTTYESSVNVLMVDFRWIPSEKGELYLTGSWTGSEAEMDALAPMFASDVPTELFPDGLTGEGPDPTAPIAFSDYQGLADIHEYSDLEFTEIRATLGFRYDVNPGIGLVGEVGWFDLKDDKPYLQDATGSASVFYAGLVWSF